MKNKSFIIYYFSVLAGVITASIYPIYMGILVVSDMIRYGTVYSENYPKYIIPYTPIALSVIIGIVLMPFLIKLVKKFAFFVGSLISVAAFFVAELAMESLVTVTRIHTETVSTLQDWQMYMCYVAPTVTTERTWKEVDVLIGEYSPAFKLHFYLISVVLIVSLLNCLYGYARVIYSKNKKRIKPLIMQSVSCAALFGMCIWACFTAFYRNGSIVISALSAILMCVFFLLFGITGGIYVASFTIDRKNVFSVVIPSVIASLITFVMYIGEMILLDWHLYRFGTGFLFNGIQGIVFAPIDIVIILLSGVITSIIARNVQTKKSV